VTTTEQARSGRRRWFTLVVLCVGQLMIVLDATVVNVALPAIQRQLHFSSSSLAWVVNAYLLTFGGLLLLAGRIGDLVGRARLFLTGLAAFSVASALCGLAPTAGVLVGARFVQGASAAMVSSMVLGIISPMFPDPRERTVALSVFATVAMGGVSLGLVLGGAVTELLSWHWIFFINVPVGATALGFSARLLDRGPGLGLGAGADVAGALLVTAAPMLVVFGLVNAGSDGWGSVLTIGPVGGGLVLAVLFVVVEARVRTPLVPLAIFRHRNLLSATLVRFLFPMGAFGFNFLGALYLQHVLHYSPLRTGMAFFPSSLITGGFSLLLTPWLASRASVRVLIVGGLTLVTAGLVSLAPISVSSGYLTILPAMLLTGAGFGLTFMPSVSVAMAGVGPDEAGVASGLANVAVQMGGSIGVALLATVAASRTTHLLAEHQSSLQALTGGYRLGLMVGAGFTAAGALAAAVLLRRVPAGASDAAIEAAALAH
jgi:EmrB/QacA subfamily drug resistance transporter